MAGTGAVSHGLAAVGEGEGGLGLGPRLLLPPACGAGAGGGAGPLPGHGVQTVLPRRHHHITG